MNCIFCGNKTRIIKWKEDYPYSYYDCNNSECSMYYFWFSDSDETKLECVEILLDSKIYILYEQETYEKIKHFSVKFLEVKELTVEAISKKMDNITLLG